MIVRSIIFHLIFLAFWIMLGVLHYKSRIKRMPKREVAIKNKKLNLILLIVLSLFIILPTVFSIAFFDNMFFDKWITFKVEISSFLKISSTLYLPISIYIAETKYLQYLEDSKKEINPLED